MGKITGFMEFDRELNPSVEPKDRIKNFNEFHPPLEKEKRCEQAARCMNCGVPFCQSGAQFGGMFSGCPLHNLIPEWNDEIYNGDWELALARLLKRNNFPEFTGRVCPALCEAACTCGMNGDSVTVRENELAIIEEGYKNGWIKPHAPAVRSGKKVAVIGSGPAGLTVADRLNARGHHVTVYERDAEPGGLLMYGIPNMKLDKKIIRRRIDIMKKSGIKFITSTDVCKDVKARTLEKEFDAIVLCCGSKKPRDLKVPGRESGGVHFAVDYLGDATRELVGEIAATPINASGKNVVIVGGGDTGNDCVGTAIRQGCASVCQLEMMPKLPDDRAENNPWPQWPRVCKTDYGQQEAIAVFGADPRVYTTTVKEIISDDNGNISAVKTVKLSFEKDKKSGRSVMKEVPGSEETIPCELLLIAAGFVGCDDYVIKSFGVNATERGAVATNGKYFADSEKIFAAGDCRRGQSLVVWAIAEGRQCSKEVDEYLMGYTNMI